jgi:hypothetical protein
MKNTDFAKIAEILSPIDLPFTNVFSDPIISQNVTSGIKQARHLEEKIAAEVDDEKLTPKQAARVRAEFNERVRIAYEAN